jgi:hypothetical protein
MDIVGSNPEDTLNLMNPIRKPTRNSEWVDSQREMAVRKEGKVWLHSE